MSYSKLSEANPALGGIKPPITLSQANSIANIADGIPEGQADNPWAVAIAQFKKSHTVKDDKWVKKEESNAGSKEVPPPCLGVKFVTSKLNINEEVNVEIDLSMNRGVKAVTSPSGEKYLVLWTSNAFQDREGETFATKSLEDYVSRVDRTGDRGRVWFWHLKGTDFADIIWQGVHGRFLLELAKPDDTEYAHKMMHAIDNPGEFPDLLPQGWSTSHGFLYHPAYKDGGVFRLMHKFESTVLPSHKASNAYGSVINILGGINMSGQVKVSKEKADGLINLVGEDTAKELLDMTKQATDLLEDKGISFKEWLDEAEKSEGKAKTAKATSPTKPAKTSDDEEEDDEEEMDEDEEPTKAAKEANDGDVFEMELTPELVKEIAGSVDVQGQVEEALKEMLPPIIEQIQTGLLDAVKEVITQTNVDTKEQIVQDALKGTLKLKPWSASKDDSNKVTKDAEELKNAAEKAEKETSPADVIVGKLVSGMMQGTIG